MSNLLRRLVGAGLVALVAPVLFGCGGGSNDSAAQELKHQQELRDARQQGAQQARQQDQIRELQKEIRQQKARQKSGNRSTTSTSTSAAPTPAPAPASGSGSSSCGGSLTVNGHTSCSFAANVRSAYANSSGGDVTVAAFSPATGKVYAMTCTTAGGQHVCTGGNGAAVYFP